ETIAELSREAGEVREISAFIGSTSPEKREDALRQMQRLQALPLEQWLPDRYLWQGAALLGQDGQLAAAYREMLDALVAGMDPAHTPKLWQPQFLWDHDSRLWKRDPEFPRLSATVAGYHARTGQIFQRLAPPEGDSGVLRDLAAFYNERKQEADGRLAALAKTWNEDWVPPLVASVRAEAGPPLSPLAELLRRPLPPDGSLRPASLERLLDLPIARAEILADPAKGCGKRPYQEDNFQYFRIDCYAYAARPAPDPPGADLRIEMRIVYQWEPGQPTSRRALPGEIYFIFPVPSGTDPTQYRADVMQAFASAVHAERDDTPLTMIDRSGLPTKGFTFEDGSHRGVLRVSSHLIGDLSGGVPAIGVRATYRNQPLSTGP